jgi:hypothetical protein
VEEGGREDSSTRKREGIFFSKQADFRKQRNDKIYFPKSEFPKIFRKSKNPRKINGSFSCPPSREGRTKYGLFIFGS